MDVSFTSFLCAREKERMGRGGIPPQKDGDYEVTLLSGRSDVGFESFRSHLRGVPMIL